MGEKIAFIGVGRMGSGMAARLITAGHALTIYDPSAPAMAAAAALGATVARSAADAAAVCTVVMISVPGPAEARETARTIVDSSTVKIFVDLSTSGPAAAQAIASLLAPHGIAAIDAVHDGAFGHMVALRNAKIVRVPLAEAVDSLKTVTNRVGLWKSLILTPAADIGNHSMSLPMARASKLHLTRLHAKRKRHSATPGANTQP